LAELHSPQVLTERPQDAIAQHDQFVREHGIHGAAAISLGPAVVRSEQNIVLYEDRRQNPTLMAMQE
jgi:hypothetical protein